MAAALPPLGVPRSPALLLMRGVLLGGLAEAGPTNSLPAARASSAAARVIRLACWTMLLFAPFGMVFPAAKRLGVALSAPVTAAERPDMAGVEPAAPLVGVVGADPEARRSSGGRSASADAGVVRGRGGGANCMVPLLPLPGEDARGVRVADPGCPRALGVLLPDPSPGVPELPGLAPPAAPSAADCNGGVFAGPRADVARERAGVVPPLELAPDAAGAPVVLIRGTLLPSLVGGRAPVAPAAVAAPAAMCSASSA